VRKLEGIKNQKEKHFMKKEKVFGQFFTPPEVANFIVDFVVSSFNTKPQLAVDPACGDGIFLKALIERGINNIIGIEVDKNVLSEIPEDVKRKSKILERDGLSFLGDEVEGKADIVVGNPPFSAKYGRITDTEILSRFELGRGRKSQAIEILFLERFLQLASKSGVIGIILPSGIFSNLPLRYVREFVSHSTAILGIVSLPRRIFRGTRSTTSKTHILFAKKQGGGKNQCFMGIANKLEDLSLILESYQKKKETIDPPAFWTRLNSDIWLSEYYFKPIRFKNDQKIVKLGELLSEMFCGKTEYGPKRIFTSSGIRFISAKTITPLGVDFSKENRGRKYIDPKSEMYKQKAHVQVGDLLFVRVGVGCIGRASVVTTPDEQGVADDWIYVIRLKNKELAYYLAFYLQSKYGVSQIDVLKRGVGTVTIPQHLLKEKLNIVLPSESRVRNFKNLYLEMVNQRKRGNEQEAKKIFEKSIRIIEEEII